MKLGAQQPPGFCGVAVWGAGLLPFELGGERHRASAATGAAHGDENVLLLLLVEIGAIEQLPGLLFEQRVQREGAIRNLILRRWLRSGLGLPCRRHAPDVAGPPLAFRHSRLRRLAAKCWRADASVQVRAMEPSCAHKA